MSVYSRVTTARSVNRPSSTLSVIANYAQSRPPVSSAPSIPSTPSERSTTTSMSSYDSASTAPAPRDASPYLYSENNHLHIIEITTRTYLPDRRREERRHVVRVPLARDKHRNDGDGEAVGRWMLEERGVKESRAIDGADRGVITDNTGIGVFGRRPSGRGLEDCRRRADAVLASRRTVVVVGGYGGGDR